MSRLGAAPRVAVVGILAAFALSLPGPEVLASPDAPRATSRVIGTLSVTRCTVIDVPGSQAWCGTLPRQWDPADPSLGTFGLSFAVALPASGTTSQPAVVGLEGGPGYGGIDSGQTYAEMLGPLLKDRALIVMDARGTGRSEAAECPSLDDESLSYQQSVARCAATLGPKADLYASAMAADDLKALIDALQVGPVHLYGDSYGTFMAQVFAGRHPDTVRSLVLDGAYPVVGESAWYPTQGHAMRTAFSVVCQRTPACAALPGTTMSRLSAVLARVRQKAVSVWAPGADGVRHQVDIDAGSLVGIAFNATYVFPTYREFDASLRAGLAGDWLPLGRLVAEYLYAGKSGPAVRGSASDYSGAESLGVSCHDYPQLFDMAAPPSARPAQYHAAIAAAERDDPGMYLPFTIRDYLSSGWSEQSDCLSWPVGTRSPNAIPGPIGGAYPDVPVLVLTGQLDTITTPAEGDVVAAQFPRARHLLVANGLHVTAMGDPEGCAATTVRSFLVQPPAVLTGADPNCAVSTIRGAPAYPRSAAIVGMPQALALTVADVIDRIWQSDQSRGLGLRGGVWHYSGWPSPTVTLSGVRLYDNLPASGTFAYRSSTGDVSVHLTARGQTWTGTWNSLTDGSMATMTRVAGGSASTATFPAP